MMGLEELQSVQEDLLQKLKATSNLIESRAGSTSSRGGAESSRVQSAHKLTNKLSKQERHTPQQSLNSSTRQHSARRNQMERSEERMARVRLQAKEELKGYLDEEDQKWDDSQSPKNRR
jgi:hypothetical protein